MDIAREATPPGQRTSDLGDLPPPERRYSDRLLPEDTGGSPVGQRRSLPPVRVPRSRSPSPQPATREPEIPGVLKESSPSSHSRSSKEKKKKKKKRGSEVSSSSVRVEESGESAPSSPASMPLGLEAPRAPCKFGAGCYRKNPDHKRQYSHPGDPDHPDTPAEIVSEEAEREFLPEDRDIFPGETGVAETPSTLLRGASSRIRLGEESIEDVGGVRGDFGPSTGSGSKPVSALDVGEGIAETPSTPLITSSSKIRLGEEGLEDGGVRGDFGPSTGSGSKPVSAWDVGEGAANASEIREALVVTPVARSPARPVCRYGEECWNTRPDHLARFSHLGDPDHPDTAVAGAASSGPAPASNHPGVSESSNEQLVRPESVQPADEEDDATKAEIARLLNLSADEPKDQEAEDPDAETPDEDEDSGAEIDFPAKAVRKRICGKRLCLMTCLVTVLIGSVVFLIIILDNMVHLREDQQLVEKTWDGERVTNGPGTVISWPHRRIARHVVRKVSRLSTLEFAALKNRRTQVVRHEEGPGLLFLRALEDLVEILPLKKLQLTQYHRLVDEQSGDERIVRGPQTYAPEPLENIVQPDCWINSVDTFIADDAASRLGQDPEVSTVENCKMKCSRMESCNSIYHCNGEVQTCIYSMQYPQSTFVLKNNVLNDDNSSDSDSPWDSDDQNLHSSANCQIIAKTRCSETDPPQEAVMINAFWGMIVENKASGLLRLVKTPGLFFPSAYEVLREWRPATLINEVSYAVLKNTLTGATNVRPGPTLVMPEAYEKVIKIGTKVVVKKDEFVRLVDRRSGAEEVIAGPAAVSPAFEEEIPDGVQNAALLDPLTSAILLDQSTGQQELKVNTGILAPRAYERILEVRPRVRVLDHQATVSRAPDGQLTFHTSSFFLAPYHEILSLPWSVYDNYAAEPAPKMSVRTIDLRVQRLPWRYVAITRDSVRIQLTGTTFWRVSDVLRMVTSTEDAPSDVAQRSKAALLSNVAQVGYRDFMASMTAISDQTSLQQTADVFYTNRGLEVSRVEIVGYEATDDAVATELRSTVVEVTTQVNRMMQAQTVIDVNTAKMNGAIRLAGLETEWIQNKGVNDLFLAISEGVKEGIRMAEEAKTYLDRLEGSVNETASRVDLYRQYHEQDAVNELTRVLSGGPAKFYLHADDTELIVANIRSEL